MSNFDSWNDRAKKVAAYSETRIEENCIMAGCAYDLSCFLARSEATSNVGF